MAKIGGLGLPPNDLRQYSGKLILSPGLTNRVVVGAGKNRFATAWHFMALGFLYHGNVMISKPNGAGAAGGTAASGTEYESQQHY